MKNAIRELYEGGAPRSVRFRTILFLFDIATIIYFIWTAPFQQTPLLNLLDGALGLAILLDFGLRIWIAEDRATHLSRIYVLADVVVIAAILLQAFLPIDLAYLRVLRALRLVHSYHLMTDLRHQVPLFRRHEDVVVALVNLLVFVFLTASTVYALSFEAGEGAASYVDALYFTVSTLTTTGYGDITPTTAFGKIASVFIMVIGVTLFVNLARAIVMPTKVRMRCPDCGLSRHEPDAVHCKHCGRTIHIPTDG